MSDPAHTPTVSILTLGCKLNLADSEAMARRMRDAGWAVVDGLAPGADAVVVNSCSVTHVADAKTRRLVREARRAAPTASIALTGCMLETAAPPIIDALGAGIVLRQPKQEELTRRLIQLHPTAAAATKARAFRTRAFVSAQEGCNDVCAFCIVPRTRGRERSKAVDGVVAEVQAREAEGVKEVVITGTQLGAWGRESGRRGLVPLLSALLEHTKVPRIRMSSVQPQDLSTEMVDLWRDPRLCRHFHLALQSGSQSVLTRMRRRYTAARYRDAAGRLRAEIPGVAITTDVIAGFPGETEAEFDETYAFCHEMAFAGMHVFPYSQRAGTAAARMPDQVPEPLKKDRVQRLMTLAGEMSESYRRRLVGSTQSVLWESSRWSEGGRTWKGLTDTYVRVFAEGENDLENRLTRAAISDVCEGGVRGTL